MERLLSIQEIKSAHPGEWVLVEHPEYGADRELLRGQAVATNADKDFLFRLAARRNRQHCQDGPVPFDLVYGGEPHHSALLLL